MCEFKSLIVDKKGKVFELEFNDSHEDIIEKHKLKDKLRIDIVRVELIPDFAKDVFDADTWEFILDEHRAPDWYNRGYEGICRDFIMDKVIPRHFKGSYKKYMYTAWHSNGQKHFECIYKNGHRNGKTIDWHSNGQKRFERRYKEGKLDGKYACWHSNGQKRFERRYKNGKLDGKYIEWDLNGQKFFECMYKEGHRVGVIEIKGDAQTDRNTLSVCTRITSYMGRL